MDTETMVAPSSEALSIATPGDDRLRTKCPLHCLGEVALGVPPTGMSEGAGPCQEVGFPDVGTEFIPVFDLWARRSSATAEPSGNCWSVSLVLPAHVRRKRRTKISHPREGEEGGRLGCPGMSSPSFSARILGMATEPSEDVLFEVPQGSGRPEAKTPVGSSETSGHDLERHGHLREVSLY